MKAPGALKNWPEWGLGFVAEPRVVRRLEDGLTNHSYLLEENNTRWVLRLNADNSEQLDIDRRVEQRILAAAASVGLSPRRYYCSPESEILVSEYLPPWQPAALGKQELDLLAARMWMLHQLKASQVPAVDYVEYTERYVAQLKHEMAWTPDLASLRDSEIRHLEAFIAQRRTLPLARLTLCHHDPSPAHWRLQGQTLCLIDWEYAALRDPACDLALLVEGWRLSPQQITVLLAGYEGGVSLERLADARRVCQYVNRLWYALQRVKET